MPAPRASIIFDADNSGLHQAVNQNLKDIEAQSSASRDLGRSVNQLVAAFVSYQTVAKLLESAKTGEALLNARREFGRYVTDVESGTARLNQAVRGTVSEMRLLQLANEGFRRGMPFEFVEKALAFAENQADQTGDSLDSVYTTLVQGMAKAEAGVGRNTGALLRYGITATTTQGIIGQITTALEQQTSELDDNSDAVELTTAAWESASQRIGVAVRTNLLPVLKSVSDLLTLADEDSLAARLAAIADSFSESRQGAGLQTGTGENALSAQFLLSGLTQDALRGAFTLEKAQAAFEELTTLQKEAPPELAAAYQEVLAALDLLIAKQKSVSANVPFGPDERDAALNSELLAQQAAEAEAQAKQNAALAEQEAARRREALAQVREELKLKIGLGQQTYQELSDLLDQQLADNKEFLQKDKAAYLGWLADRVAVYQNDKAESQKSESEKYNSYQRYISDILESDKLAQEEKYQLALEGVNGAIELEQWNTEHTRQLYDTKRAIEQEYRQFIMQGYNEQLQLLQSVFGNPALQLVDSFFTSAEIRFEDFIKNILRMAARYALQSLLLRLFGSILGNPFGGIPGLNGGSGNFDFGISSVPGTPALIPQIPNLSSFSVPSSIAGGSGRGIISVNPTPVSVQVLATAEQLAATVHHGNTQRDRSNLGS